MKIPSIVSHNISTEPEYLFEKEDSIIMCNVSVNSENSSGRFLWQLDGFELRSSHGVWIDIDPPCISDACGRVDLKGVMWEVSGK